MLPNQFVQFLGHTKMLLKLLYRKQEIKNLILINLVRQVWLSIFYSNTKLPTMNCSYFFTNFLVLFMGYNIRGKQVSIQKK
jgi:hypothetical protein